MHSRLEEIFNANVPRTEMSSEETKVFLDIAMSDNMFFSMNVNEVDKESEIGKHFKPLIDAFQIQVFLKRLKHLTTLRITLGALVVMAEHIGASAGVAVMYAYYVHHKLKPNTLITLEVIANELFPWGFFSEEQLLLMWDEQKVLPKDGLDEYTCCGAPDNLIDYVECWKDEKE